MAYAKTNWVNDGPPAINASNLNKLEVGVDEAHDHADAIGNPHGTTAAEVGALTQAGGDGRYVQQANHTKAAHDSLGIDAATLDGVDGSGYVPASHVGSGGTAHANAVASGAAGFQSGADKAKLDGIEDGATGDQTRAEVVGLWTGTPDGTKFLRDDGTLTTPAGAAAPASIDGVSNPGGNIDLVAGTGMTITPDDAANTITFASSGGGGGGSGPFNDDVALVRDATDNTRQMRVEVGAVATGTVRVLTMPDSDVDLANTPTAGQKAALPGTTGTPGAANRFVTETDPKVTADQAAGTASIRTLGTGAQQALPGNDSRLTAGVAGVATVRALGTGSTEAAAGNDPRFTKYLALPFFRSGDVGSGTTTGVGHFPVMVAGTVDQIRATLDTAPTGGTVTATFVREAGGPGGTATTIGSVTFSAGARTATASTGLSVAVALGDSVRVDLTTGANYAAASAKNLTASARMTY